MATAISRHGQGCAQGQGRIPSTTMRLPNIGPDATQLDKAEEGMRAAGLL